MADLGCFSQLLEETEHDHNEHDFLVPSGSEAVAVQEGMWRNFATHPQRLAQLQANEISYSWDRLVEIFNKHLFAGTQYRVTHADLRSTSVIPPITPNGSYYVFLLLPKREDMDYEKYRTARTNLLEWDEALENAVDVIENVIYQPALAGDVIAAIFYTQGPASEVSR